MKKARRLKGVEMGEKSLAGRRVIIPERRELDLFSTMIARHGAEVIRCPLVAVARLADFAKVDAWLERHVAGLHDLVILYTGEGVVRLAERAEEVGCRTEFVAALAKAVKLARGPKPASALRKLGLSAELMTSQHTTDGLLAILESQPLDGRTMAVQLYPDAPVERIQREIEARGGRFDPVLPYGYVAENADAEVASAIEMMAAGEIDLIAFTSQLQVQRLSAVAARRGMESMLERAFAQTAVAAIGPITADAVRQAGGTVLIQPERSFHMKPLVADIVRRIGSQ